MNVIGIEEIFLDVRDLDKAIDFYHHKLSIPIAKRNEERAYLQCERGHIVLQIKTHGGRHRGGGPRCGDGAARLSSGGRSVRLRFVLSERDGQPKCRWYFKNDPLHEWMSPAQ
jgi:catechol 2,3-dioxygenase-like lactoylglutathione lyase family enzyme